MAESPHLADFLAKNKGSGAGTKSALLPPVIAPGLFSSITGASEAGNYNSLNRIAQRIQQARADSDSMYAMKQQRKREAELKKMINNLARQVQAANSGPSVSIPGASVPSYSGGGSSGRRLPSGLVSAPPRIAPRRGTGLNPGAGISLPIVGRSPSSILPILK